MVGIDTLFVWAKALKIRIIYKKLNPGLLGRADATKMVVTLDPSLRDKPRELKCVLAEEIGHILYPPRPGHIRYHSMGFWETDNCGQTKITVAQDERKALDWATSVLMPDVEFNRIMEEGNHYLWEIADEFGVEQWFLEHKIGYYRLKAREMGRKVKWRDLIRRV
ncbi:MAG TPA: ImmA/IrrE family metallo-endopeptidase [Desulfotomaculum sp.]|nr:MAG: hypothetical protein JL56_02750 [Desulfotomaculum sp. BICA1-6]HBX22620.1 ImmA/IrrE family metallo-endopeptidase [Desulfotomaculum sp.]